MNLRSTKHLSARIELGHLDQLRSSEKRAIDHRAEDVRLTLQDYWRSGTLEGLVVPITENKTRLETTHFMDMVALRALFRFEQKRGFQGYAYDMNLTHFEQSFANNDDSGPNSLFFRRFSPEESADRMSVLSPSEIQHGLSILKFPNQNM